MKIIFGVKFSVDESLFPFHYKVHYFHSQRIEVSQRDSSRINEMAKWLNENKVQWLFDVQSTNTIDKFDVIFSFRLKEDLTNFQLVFC